MREAIEAQADKHRAIQERDGMRPIVRNTTVGLGLVAAGFLLTGLFGAPWWVAAVACLMGGIMITKQLTVDAMLELAIGLARDGVDVAARILARGGKSHDDTT